MTYTEEIRGTEVYKLYDDDFNGLVVPTTQPSRVVSTKGTHRKLSTPRKPIQKSNLKKKWEKSPGESSAPLPIPMEAEEKETLKKVETMVDEVDEEEFVDYLIATQEDLGTRIETWSHKESPKEESEEEMHKKKTSVKDDFCSLINTELATTALNHIEELFQRYMQTHIVAF
ncbi:hypothetical protein Tco_1435033 [Tanacetum coccineum]